MSSPQWYLDYLATERWRGIRKTMLALAGHRCQGLGCRMRINLQVHHLTYERLGDERVGDLKVLCVGCHLRAHDLPLEPPAKWNAPQHIRTILPRVLAEIERTQRVTDPDLLAGVR